MFDCKRITALLGFILVFLSISDVGAHHVLGRPSYSLDEDSNTPPSMQLESQIGRYFVTITVFPAFPKPGQLSLVKFYASHRDSEAAFDGIVHFSVRDDQLFGSSPQEEIGVQKAPISEGIYSQGMVFQNEGYYILSIFFEAGGEPYTVDLPLTIGTPPSHGPVLAAVGVIGLVMILIPVAKRLRSVRMHRMKEKVAGRLPPESHD